MSNLNLSNAARDDDDYDVVLATIANGEDVNDFHVSDIYVQSAVVYT